MNLKKVFNMWSLKIMIKCGDIQNWLLIIIKILHITIAVIQNAKEEDILDTLKIKNIKMKLTLIQMKILLQLNHIHNIDDENHNIYKI